MVCNHHQLVLYATLVRQFWFKDPDYRKRVWHYIRTQETRRDKSADTNSPCAPNTMSSSSINQANIA